MGRRKTVGFLASGIMDEMQEQLCKGIFKESSKDDVNIVVIPVKYIDREMKDIPDLYEYQYKTNAESITANNIDCLVIAADCIGCLTTEENLVRFVDGIRDKGIPIILAAANMDGYSGVVFDNKAGIIEGMEYLVEDLGIRRIGMLKSLEHNADVAERYEAYREMMEYYKLDIDPKSVITTNLSTDCKAECEQLLDDNPDLEAVICVNDDVALGLYDVMKSRGLVPGKDLKVMGFDNSISGSMVTPSLATVDASAESLGERVYMNVRLLLEDWPVGQMTIPTRFILRDSFGSFLDMKNIDDEILNKNFLDKYFHRIFFKFDNISSPEDFEILVMYKSLMNMIIDYVEDNSYSHERVEFIKSKADDFFRTGVMEYTDVDVLLAYIHRVCLAVTNRVDNYEEKCHVYDTFSAILEGIIAAVHNNDLNNENSLNQSINNLKNLVEDTLDLVHGGDEGYANIVSNLKLFGVNNAYVYIYEQPIVHKQGEELEMPETVLLKVAMTDGDIKLVPSIEQPVEIDHLFNNRFITTEKFNMVLMPLYFRETLYGSILYDLTDVTYRSGDFMAKQYATTARVIDILKRG